MPPAITARRSSFRPGRSSRSTRPACRQRSISQRSPGGVMRPSVTPLAASSCETAPTVPDEPRASRQCEGAKGSSASSSSAPAATCAARNAGLGEAAVLEVAHRQTHAADAERLGVQRLATLAEDHLGGATTDVDHEARHVGRLQPRDAGVDQAGLFAPGDDLDRMPQHALRAREEGVAVARLAQRLRGHGTHLLRRTALQALARTAPGTPARAPRLRR